MAAGCEGKERFATFREADRRAWFMMARAPLTTGQAPPQLAAYRCPDCDGYHYGTRSQRPKAASTPR
jgi:hypothetical protein